MSSSHSLSSQTTAFLTTESLEENPVVISCSSADDLYAQQGDRRPKKQRMEHGVDSTSSLTGKPMLTTGHTLLMILREHSQYSGRC